MAADAMLRFTAFSTLAQPSGSLGFMPSQCVRASAAFRSQYDMDFSFEN
jgi:hypothetical protein